MNAKRLFVRSAILLILCVLASAATVGAFALSHSDPLLYADLSRAAFQFDYTPPANSEYALYLFSENGDAVHAQAELWENGELIASGEGSGEILSSWLVSGTEYTVRVYGSGNAIIEMSRKALSRCYGDPLRLKENSSNGKMIARAYDAHWYAFTAEESGGLLLCGVPDETGLDLQALLMDENGQLIARFDDAEGGACRIEFTTEAGKNYFVRICSPNGAEGYYHLNLIRPDAPDAPVFGIDTRVVSMGGSIDLTIGMEGDALLWTSDAPEIAFVGQDGRVNGSREGSAMITAYGFGASASCRVEVRLIPLEGISFMGESIRLAAGDDTSVELEFMPADASVQAVSFVIGDPELAQISKNGVLQALKPGKTTLQVFSMDGKYSDSIGIQILPAAKRYRALLVGEQNYPASVNTTRNGSGNSVEAIASMLGTMRYESAAFQVKSCADLSKSELIYEIRSQFGRAAEGDISLLYISCHGSYSGGMSFLELTDGSSLAVRDLERELRRIPGTVVVMIDCCGSGGAIGKSSDYAAFARGVGDAFANPAIALSKYKVICSAGLDQDSFRIAFNENADSGQMASVFARALCDGAGWNIDRSSRSAMGADRNYDNAVSLAELAEYMQLRVDWYLEIASELTGERYIQSVQVFPEDDPFLLFER